jgi:hypothetical protein
LIEANIALLSERDLDEFIKFKTHAQAFENHQYNRLDEYPQFPTSFEECFKS